MLQRQTVGSGPVPYCLKYESVGCSGVSSSLQPPGLCVARQVLQCVAMLFSGGSSRLRDHTRVSCTASGICTVGTTTVWHLGVRFVALN